MRFFFTIIAVVVILKAFVIALQWGLSPFTHPLAHYAEVIGRL